MASAFQSQLTEPVAEGTFDRHPGLRVVLRRGRVRRLPAFLWRADKVWRGLRREVPVDHAAAVAGGARAGARDLQPVDGPPDPRGWPGRRAARQRGAALFSHRLPHGHRRRGSPRCPTVPDRCAASCPRTPARSTSSEAMPWLTPSSTATSTTRRSRDGAARLPARAWRERRSAGGRLARPGEQYRETLGDRSYIGAEYPRPTPRAARTDAWPPNGTPPASDLAFTARAAARHLGRRVRGAEPAAGRAASS